MPGKDEVPSTVERSDDKAERTWVKTYDSAMDSYDDDGARARRTAFAALKHTHEKVGDHWEPKDSYGPSDEQAAVDDDPLARQVGIVRGDQVADGRRDLGRLGGPAQWQPAVIEVNLPEPF